MLNDTIISGLLNLFALLSARYNSRMERCVTLISNYLESYFGIKNKANYIGLFTDLHELYASEELDKDSIVLSISNNIKKEIVGIKLKILLLRLMEFCGVKEGHLPADDRIPDEDHFPRRYFDPG